MGQIHLAAPGQFRSADDTMIDGNSEGAALRQSIAANGTEHV
jgi:hypothetical protein